MVADGKVLYEVDYDAAKADRSLDKISAKAKITGEKMGNVGSVMTSKLTAPILAGAAAGVAGFVALSNSLDEVKKSAIGVGAGVEGLQALQYAGTKAGVEADKMTDTLKKVQEVVSSNSDKFSDLGIDLTDTNGDLLETDQIFRDLMSTVADMPSGERQKVLLGLGFTEELTTLNKLLDENSGFVDNYADGIKNAVSEEEIKNFENFNDSLEDIKNQLIPIAASLATEFLPYFQQFADWFSSDGVKAIDDGLPKLIAFVDKYGVAIGAIVVAGPILKGASGAINGIGVASKVATPLMSALGLSIGATAGIAAVAVVGFDDLKNGLGSFGRFLSGPQNIIKSFTDDTFSNFEDMIIGINQLVYDWSVTISAPLNAVIETLNVAANGIAKITGKDIYNIPKITPNNLANNAMEYFSPGSSANVGSAKAASISGGSPNIGSITINAQTEMSPANVGRFTNEVFEKWSYETQLRGIIK